jgi:hypothetical protein
LRVALVALHCNTGEMRHPDRHLRSRRQTGLIDAMTPTQAQRYIAIVGGLAGIPDEATRQRATDAARALGRALARAGFKIIVYSADPKFIEPYVVEGYIGSGAAKDKSIRVEYPPPPEGNIEFAALKTHQNAFDLQPSADPNWEVSFYNSLSAVEGILLIGGGRSTLIAGLVGLGSRATVLPIRTFGGYARNVWDKMRANPDPLTRDDMSLLAVPDWNQDTASQVVALLDVCADRLRKRTEAMRVQALRAARATQWSAAAAVVLFLATAAIALSMAVVDWLKSPATLGFILGVGALTAGLSGSLIRTVADLYDSEVPTERPLYVTGALGIVAGVFAAMLVAIPHMTVHLPEELVKVTPEVKQALQAESIRGAGATALFAAFLTGFALDQFFRNLREVKLKKVEFPGSG